MNLVKYFSHPTNLLWDDWFDDKKNDEPAFYPNANISGDKNGYNLALDVPGIDKKNISISIKDGMLTIEGERKNEEKKEEEGYVRYESSFGKFKRSWKVDEIDTNNIKAEHKDGILKLYLPKKKEILEKDQVKQIEIT